MENNKCELLECKSRKAVEDFVKELKQSYCHRWELPYNHHFTKEEIGDIPSYINTDRLTQTCLRYAFTDPLHTSNKYLASQLMMQLIYQLDLNGRSVYRELVYQTQTDDPSDYYFSYTDVRGQDCLILARGQKSIGEPITTASNFKKALKRIIDTQGDSPELQELITTLAPVINWNLPFGPINSFAAVPTPTR